MKRFAILLSIALTGLQLFAQVPEKMSYQAVIRNSSDDLVVNSQVGMKISIQKYVFGLPPTYQNVYIETHTPTTNDNGLVSLKIGDGTVVGGVFADIDWSDGEYYIKTETDPTGGTNYTISGTTQLLSVPYALHAKNAKTYKVGDFAHGGIVFWVDESSQHGLVCAKIDQHTGIRWNNGSIINTLAHGTGIGSGFMNSMLILSLQGTGTMYYAARKCVEFTSNEGGIYYGGWFLPSLRELLTMYENKTIINATAIANGGSAFLNGFYWSSSQEAQLYANAKVVDFSTGNFEMTGTDETHAVRLIRAF